MAAACELIDEAGIDAFGMRTLARRLDTSTATIYRHVTGMEELRILVVDRLLGEVRASAATRRSPGSWQEAARRDFLLFHDALSRHPNLLGLFASEVPIGPNGLAVRERTITRLLEFGFPVSLAARAYTTLAHYVIGFLAQQHAPDAPGPRQAAALRRYYLELDPVAYPSTVAAAEALTTVSHDDEFLEGLQFILDGIDTALARGGD